jgi:hypothetical protein
MQRYDQFGDLFQPAARPPWQTLAACRCSGLDFFSLDHDVQAACIEVCRHCPVMGDCLRQAVEHREPEGVWAGEVVTKRRLRTLARRLYGPEPVAAGAGVGAAGSGARDL